MDERIGFIGIVMEDLTRTAQVNAIVAHYQDMVLGRIGVPDHQAGLAVIGLLIRGEPGRVGAFTGKLGNVSGVSVKSAMTSKSVEKRGNDHEKNNQDIVRSGDDCGADCGGGNG